MKDKKALLIIDMQKGSFTPKTPRYDTEGVVGRINAIAQHFRRLDLPVLCIQHDGTGTGEFEKGSKEWENLDELQLEIKDIFIDKRANDIFYESKLQSKLLELEVNALFITGCATDFCVEATIQSALAKDYQVTVVADGHTTAERPHLTAEQVINHYNWVWQNMIPTKGGVKVSSAEEIMNALDDT